MCEANISRPGIQGGEVGHSMQNPTKQSEDKPKKEQEGISIT